MKNTWTCHICGEEKEDSLIGVLTYPMKGLAGGEYNVRYCKDNPTCIIEVMKWRNKGEFPYKKIRVKKVVKKWWEFWK